MLRAPGPWYPTGQSGGPGAYSTQPLVVSSGRSRVPVWWVIAQLVSVVASVKCVRQPVRLGEEARPESAPWQIPRALGWGRQSFPAQAPGLLVQGRGQAADGRGVGGGDTGPPPPHGFPPAWPAPPTAQPQLPLMRLRFSPAAQLSICTCCHGHAHALTPPGPALGIWGGSLYRTGLGNFSRKCLLRIQFRLLLRNPDTEHRHGACCALHV